VTTARSVTPLASKLGVKPGSRICLVGERAEWLTEGLPPDVEVRRRLSPAGADTVVLFCRDAASLSERIERSTRSVHPDGAVWVAWPRKAAGHSSDLGDDAVREIVLPTGMVDVKVAALSEDWSGLRFVWRKELRSRTLPKGPRLSERGREATRGARSR
jgi:hypothetical protein